MTEMQATREKDVLRRRRKLLRLFQRFAYAKEALSWAGSMPEEDRDAIAEEYNNAFAAVKAEIERLIR